MSLSKFIVTITTPGGGGGENLTATAVFPSSTPAGVGGYKYIDENSAPVDLATVEDQSGATRTWSIVSGKLVANGTPGVDHGVTIQCTTVNEDTVDITIDASTDGVAISNYSEWAANANAGKGKLIYIRKGANCDIYYGTNSTFPGTGPLDKTNGIGTTVMGEAYVKGSTENYHINRLWTRGWRNVDLRSLNCRKTYFWHSSGDTRSEHISFQDCSLVPNLVDPNGDYTVNPPNNDYCAYMASTGGIRGIEFIDCHFGGSGTGGSITNGQPMVLLLQDTTYYCDIIGCTFERGFNDYFRITGATYICGCEFRESCNDSATAAGDLHVDYIQDLGPGSGSYRYDVCIEGNTFHHGTALSTDVSGCIFLKGDGALSNPANLGGWGAIVRGNVVSQPSTIGIYVDRINGAEIKYNSLVPRSITSTLTGANHGTIFTGQVETNNNSDVSYNYAPGLSLAAGDSPHDNVSMAGWDETRLTAALPDWDMGVGILRSWEEIMAAAVPNPAGELAGLGASVIISKTPGAKLSTYSADVTVPEITPTQSAVGTTTATIAVATNIPVGNPIFWAVVPQATSVTDIDLIKKRRITGGVAYGMTTVPNVSSVDVEITGLTTATAYKFVCFQRNGWSKNSGVQSVNFTTN